jgi:hypothetical protein
MQQRGISAAAIEVLLSYGRTSHDQHGGEIVFFDKAARPYAILGSDGMVVTVGHRTRCILRS